MATQPLPSFDDLEHDYPSASAYTRRSIASLKRDVKAGRLVGYRVGPRALRFRTADLDALISPAHADPLDAAVDKIVATAPGLTPAQRDRLAVIFAGTSQEVTQR